MRRSFELRHLKFFTFDGTSSKNDDWALRFKRAMRPASSDAYKLLTTAERETNEVKEDDMDKQFDVLPMDFFDRDVRFVVSSVHERRAVVRLTICTGSGLGIDCSSSTTHQTMARAVLLVGAFTHLAKVKELKHVEAALQKWEEQLKVQKNDTRAVFSETGRAGIVMAMMSESIQKFVYSSLGIAVG